MDLSSGSNSISADSFDPAQLAELGNRLLAKLEEANQAYYTFKPRPDDPAAFDEQESFINERINGVAIHQGGNGCLHPDEPLTDCVTGETRAIKDWVGVPLALDSYDTEACRMSQGWSPGAFLKGHDDIYRVQLSNGEHVLCTLDHKFLNPWGDYTKVRDCIKFQRLQCPTKEYGYVSVVSVELVKKNAPFYDLTVHPFNNYVHKGVISRNSGTTTAMLRKAVLFMLHHCPPPRKDTPFWFVTPNYEIGIKTLWKEKLFGRGHLPKSEIDFNRISWFEKKTELPISVPLKPWPRERGGHPQKNWMIEFKSWMSGREALQGSSIGGFGISEQIPWEILQEIYTRCRDMHLPGSMSYEFTPIDPAMTAELESIIAQGKLPARWKVYRSSTIRNAQSGHVSADWLESFKGAISDEMLETRLFGHFPAFEGVIYPSFRIPIHTKRSEDVQRMMWEAQKDGGLIHRRALDWGTSKDHPFVTIFGARDARGRWYIYDEVFSEDQMIADEMISLVMNKREWPDRNPNYGTTYADPSRPDLMRSFAQHMSIMAANNAVYEGIESVRVALKIWEDGYPGLIIDGERCPNLVRQLRGYRWLQSPKTGLNPRAARPEPLKRDDDCPDALRYLLHSERRTGGEMMGSLSTHREVPTHLLASHRWGSHG